MSDEPSNWVSPTSHPQVALATLSAPDGTVARVEFSRDGSFSRYTWWVPAPPGGGTVSILVAGMLAGSTYNMRARFQWPSGSSIVTGPAQFKTGPLPSGLPTLTAGPTPGASPSPGVELVNIIDPIGISLVPDLNGNILWYYNNVQDKGWGGYAFPIKQLANGNFLASITNLYMPNVPPNESVLREVDLAGDTVQVPAGPRELWLADLNQKLTKVPSTKGTIVQALTYSHDVLPLPDGGAVLIVQEVRSVFVSTPPGPGEFVVLGDALVHLDAKWNPVWVWSTFDNLDVNRHPYGFDAQNQYDWTHCNTIALAPDGNLLLSSRHQNWILKICWEGGAGDGKILWTFGYQGSFALQGGDPTQWCFAQHYAHIIEASGNQITTLSVFDNGNDRCYASPEGCGPSAPPPFSRGAMFKIDEVGQKAALAWQYLLNQYSFWGGNTVLLPNGDIEVCASEPVPIGPGPAWSGSEVDTPSYVVELSPSMDVVWRMEVITGGAYRSYRIPSLYPGVTWS